MNGARGIARRACGSPGILCLTSVLLCLGVIAFLPADAAAATITFTNKDSAGEGFNDPTAVSPVGGNPGTTLGAQRQNAFQHALNLWGSTLSSNVTITVGAQFNPLGGTSTSAVLGSCGPNNVLRDFPGAPRASTFYASALAASYYGADIVPGQDDMDAEFNSDVDNGSVLGAVDWYYGYDGNPGTDIEFIKVALHEVAHGVGFLSLVDETTGAKFYGYDDAYMVFLENHSTLEMFPAMSDAGRLGAITNNGNLHWTGPHVVGYSGYYTAGVDTSNGHVRMYAPTTYEAGSSVSHFDIVLTPNELMEPIHTSDSTWDLTRMLLRDIGWNPLDDGYIRLTQPNGGGSYQAGTNQVITWSSGNLASGELLKIDLYKGGVFHSVLGDNTPNDGSFDWPIAAGVPAGSDYRVRITSKTHPVVWDDSDANFSVTGTGTPAWRSGEADLGGGWRWTSWLGYYNMNYAPWVYHQEHRWLYPLDDGAGGVYFWYNDMAGFVWTKPATYPYLYRFGTQAAWLWYLKGSANPRWFYNLTTGAWESLP